MSVCPSHYQSDCGARPSVPPLRLSIMAPGPVPSSGSSQKTVENGKNQAIPDIPKEEVFDDDSKVPFITLRTFMMTVLVSMGGICFG